MTATQLIGTDLIAKVDEMRDVFTPTTEIVKACGYVQENGKADYVEFYGALIKAKGLDVPSDDDTEENELYNELVEKFGEDAVEAFCEIWGEDDLEHFEEAFQGVYRNGAEFAREIGEDLIGNNFPSFIEIDWEETWENLRYDYCEENGYIFSTNW
jgi:hypothetical protein